MVCSYKKQLFTLRELRRGGIKIEKKRRNLKEREFFKNLNLPLLVSGRVHLHHTAAALLAPSRCYVRKQSVVYNGRQVSFSSGRSCVKGRVEQMCNVLP
jgi:hypothetical protein